MVPPLGAAMAVDTRVMQDDEKLRQEISRILLVAETSAGSLRALYTLFKSRQRKVSLTYICRRSGIPSKGYLAFVMSGKRKLNMKYWSTICQTFKLSGVHEHILRTQLQLEMSDCPESKLLLQEQLQTLRLILQES